MDSGKTGKFIAQSRKELNITQKQLADQLGISDKTVSKWECGKGMPDIEMITPLCACLQINVNELISGERLSENNYSHHAEENMMTLMKEKKKEQKTGVKVLFGCLVTLLVMVAIIGLLIILSGSPSIIYFLDMTTLGLLLIFLFAVLFGADLFRDFWNAFSYAFSAASREAAEKAEVERAVQAMILGRKTLYYSGLFITVFSIEVILVHLDDPALLGPNLSVAMLSMVYAMIAVIPLLSLESRLKAFLLKSSRE